MVNLHKIYVVLITFYTTMSDHDKKQQYKAEMKSLVRFFVFLIVLETIKIAEFTKRLTAMGFSKDECTCLYMLANNFGGVEINDSAKTMTFTEAFRNFIPDILMQFFGKRGEVERNFFDAELRREEAAHHASGGGGAEACANPQQRQSAPPSGKKLAPPGKQDGSLDPCHDGVHCKRYDSPQGCKFGHEQKNAGNQHSSLEQKISGSKPATHHASGGGEAAHHASSGGGAKACAHPKPHQSIPPGMKDGELLACAKGQNCTFYPKCRYGHQRICPDGKRCRHQNTVGGCKYFHQPPVVMPEPTKAFAGGGGAIARPPLKSHCLKAGSSKQPLNVAALVVDYSNINILFEDVGGLLNIVGGQGPTVQKFVCGSLPHTMSPEKMQKTKNAWVSSGFHVHLPVREDGKGEADLMIDHIIGGQAIECGTRMSHFEVLVVVSSDGNDNGDELSIFRAIYLVLTLGHHVRLFCFSYFNKRYNDLKQQFPTLFDIRVITPQEIKDAAAKLRTSSVAAAAVPAEPQIVVECSLARAMGDMTLGNRKVHIKMLSSHERAAISEQAQKEGDKSVVIHFPSDSSDVDLDDTAPEKAAEQRSRSVLLEYSAVPLAVPVADTTTCTPPRPLSFFLKHYGGSMGKRCNTQDYDHHVRSMFLCAYECSIEDLNIAPVDDSDFKSSGEKHSRQCKPFNPKWIRLETEEPVVKPTTPEFVQIKPTKTAKQLQQERLARLKETNPRLYKALTKKD
jgi:hypothetical protein